MALLDFMRRRRGRFVSADEHQRNVASQIKDSPQILGELQKFGVTAAHSLRLEYFFYTDSTEKALALVESLRSLGYEPIERPSASDQKMRLVTGWSRPIRMSKEDVSSWVRQMCEVGYEKDCDFDGWGTSPDAT